MYVHSFFRANVRSYMIKCWKAWCNGRESPEQIQEEKEFHFKVCFFAAITESVCQLNHSSIILRIFGISSSVVTRFFQYFSLVTSIMSITFSFITVSFSKHVKKVELKIFHLFSRGLFSCNLSHCLIMIKVSNQLASGCSIFSSTLSTFL